MLLVFPIQQHPVNAACRLFLALRVHEDKAPQEPFHLIFMTDEGTWGAEGFDFAFLLLGFALQSALEPTFQKWKACVIALSHSGRGRLSRCPLH